MGFAVCTGALLQCSFGAAPSSMMVLPSNMLMGGSMPLANVLDNKPLVNIMPFGMCQSMMNPTVAAATAAAMGVLTPMPCIPVLPSPWIPGSSTVMIAGSPALNNSCKLTCAYGGMITINSPGQTNIMIP